MSADTAGLPASLRLAELPPAAVRLAGCGFFFDFDGTLAEICDDPQAAAPVTGVLPRLAALAARAARVGVVSARPVEFLRSRFEQAPQLRLFGLYGLETAVGGQVRVHPDAAGYLELMAALVAQARAQLPAGVVVEDKRLTVALHYRRAPELAGAVHDWAVRQRARHGLRLQEGRMVVELKPPGDRNKGSVLREESADLDGAWYFGDDLGDVAAFDALSAARRERPGFGAVRVLVVNAETGAGLTGHADLVLDAPGRVPALLDWLLAQPDRER